MSNVKMSKSLMSNVKKYKMPMSKFQVSMSKFQTFAMSMSEFESQCQVSSFQKSQCQMSKLSKNLMLNVKIWSKSGPFFTCNIKEECTLQTFVQMNIINILPSQHKANI